MCVYVCKYVSVCVCVYTYTCVCVCVCLWFVCVCACTYTYKHRHHLTRRTIARRRFANKIREVQILKSPVYCDFDIVVVLGQ